MDLSPAGTTHPARHSAWPDPDPTPDGQDHDRMETDDDSSSEDDLANPQDNPTHAAQNHLQYHEVMDTTPDEPHWEENVEEHVDGNTGKIFHR